MTTTMEKRTRKPGNKPSSILAGRRVSDQTLRTRSRRTGLVTAAALLMVMCGLGFALLLSQAGNKTAVLTIRGPVAKGHVIERADLTSTQISGATGVIETADSRTVIGKIAAVDLVSGQILTRDMVTSNAIPGKGKAAVGLSLDLTRVPSAGLKPGSAVDVVAVPGGDNGGTAAELDDPRLLARGAEVYSVGKSAAQGGGLVVTLIVDSTDAPQLAAYSTSNRVAVVETSPADGGS